MSDAKNSLRELLVRTGEMNADIIQRQKLVKFLTRRFEFPEWEHVWDVFDEIASDKYENNSVRACAACGMSALSAANNPHSILYGMKIQMWNENDDAPAP